MNKLTITRLAWKNLRRGKKQYLIMAVSILLSMVFSSGILFFLSSVRASNKEANLRALGKQDFIVPEPSADMLSRLQADLDIGEIGLVSVLGWAAAEDKEKGSAIASLDDTAREVYYLQILEGRYPEKHGEIAIEEDALNRMRITAAVGEQIALQVYPANGASFLETQQSQTYTLVGILENRRKSLEYITKQAVVFFSDDTVPAGNRLPAAFVAQEEEVLPGGKAGQMLLCCDARESKKDIPFGTYYREKYDLDSIIFIDKNSFFATVLEKKVDAFMIVGFVLLAASALGIAGAYQANLAEKKHRIGMLRAVGATKRQIFSIFLREAVLLALAVLPLSLLVSFFGTCALIYLIDKNAVFVPDYKTLLAASAFGLACVFFSAVFPILGVLRIPPMAAVRGTERLYRQRKKKIKSQTVFSPVKLISSRRSVFYPFKKRVSVVLLAVAVVITCFGSYMITDMRRLYPERAHDFDVYGKESVEGMVNYDFSDGTLTESDKAMVADFRGVKTVHGQKSISVLQHMESYDAYYELLSKWQSVKYNQTFSEPKNYEEYKQQFFVSPTYNMIRSQLGIQDDLWRAQLYALDEESLTELSSKIVEGKIDLEKINNGTEVLLLCAPRVGLAMQFHESGFGMNFLWLSGRENALELKNVAETAGCPVHAGDKIKLSTIKSDLTADRYQALATSGDDAVPDDLRRTEREVTVGAILTDQAYGGQTYHFYTSLSAFGLFGGGGKYDAFSVDMNSPVTEETEKDFKDWIDSIFGVRTVHVISRNEEQRRVEDAARNSLVAVLSVMIVAIAVLTVLIGNFLTAQIRADKQTIGTLRAVGADQRVIGKIYYRQLAEIIVWGAACGYGTTLLIQGGYYLFSILRPTLDLIRGGLRAEYWQAGLLAAVILLLCLIRIWNAVRREQKHSIVENIREL